MALNLRICKTFFSYLYFSIKICKLGSQGGGTCDICNSGGPGEIKKVDSGMIECSMCSESVKNEVYAQFNPYAEGLSGFRALFLHLTCYFGRFFDTLKIHTLIGNSNVQKQIFRKLSSEN